MEKYSKEKRLIIVNTNYKNGASFSKTVRQLRQVFGHNNAPNESTVRPLITKFETKSTLMDQKTVVRRRPCRSLEKIATVRESEVKNPGTFIRHRDQELNICKSTMPRILVQDLHLHAYKVQSVQQIRPRNHA